MTQPQSKRRPAVIVVSSHVVRGTVGNRAAALALEALGFPVWLVPTTVLPWHPGQGMAKRITAKPDDFQVLLETLSQSPKLPEVGAILTGYLGNSEQVEPLAQLVKAVKKSNPDAIYTLDPVIGDGDRLYVDERQAEAMRTHLLPLADVVTPNLFELGWLADRSTPQNHPAILETASQLSVRAVLTTSAPAMMRGNIGNLLLQDDKAWLAEHRVADGPSNGLGDLTAALLLGNLLTGLKSDSALQRTCAAVSDVMAISAQRQSDELLLETALPSLTQPRSPVTLRAMQV